MQNSPFFLVVVGDSAAKERYMEELKAIGASYVMIERPDELNTLPKHNEYCGMMVDMNSFARLTTLQKTTVKEYALVLPTVRLFLDLKAGDLKINDISFEDTCIENIDEFVKSCATFPARSIRREPRYNILLNAMLGDHLTIITDISRSGCFIFTTDESIQAGDRIEFATTDLGDQTPIKCIIRRKVEWGKEGQAAGIGVEFVSMTEVQRINLDAILSKYEGKMFLLLDAGL